MTADAGVGKTAIAAEAARRLAAEAFFVNASQNLTSPQQWLNHVCVALIAGHSLPYDHLPLAVDDSSFFLKVLEQAVATAGSPVWVVVDGLDEADQPATGRNSLLLPPHLPTGDMPSRTCRSTLVSSSSPESDRCA